MKFRRFNNFIWITSFFILVTLGWSSTCVAQKSTDTISTVVIDSAPKKLYSELYSDETGNQFMVEIYEEPQEGENLIHFRSFKNGKIIGRKSQALAYAHNFTFFIDETEQRIMRQDTEKMLYNVLKKLMEESDQKLKTNLEDLLDQEKLAQALSEKIKTPDEEIEAMATRISKEIQTPDDQIAAMATRISKEITFDGGSGKHMAERVPEQSKTHDDHTAAMATRISKEIKTPDDQIAAIATRISKEIQTPDDQISDMATRISRQIKTPEARVNEDSLALTLAIKLTQKENLVAMKIPPYADLLSQVSATNEQQEYEKTIELLDEDIANRTPDEQRKALKISGLMSVLVASKKLKRAISTINDYDLPDDPGLREISAALSEWLSKNLITD